MNLEFRTARAAGPVAPRSPHVERPVPDYRPPQYVDGPFRLVSDRHTEARTSPERHDSDSRPFASLSHWGLH